VYQLQLGKKDLAIERDMARDELIATQEQLAKTGTRLAIVAEEKNGKSIDMITDVLLNSASMANSLLLLLTS
jgi:hypothetical protein